MSPTPSAPFARSLGIFGSVGGDGEGHGGGKADNDFSTDRQRLVVPRIADVGLEELALARLDIVAERAAEVGDEAHPASHHVAAVPRGLADGDILGAGGQDAPGAPRAPPGRAGPAGGGG